MVQALAYKEAAAAAQVVDETEIATALSHKASDHETKAHHLYRDAKALGYFGGVSADPV